MSIYKAGRPNKYNPTTGKGQPPPSKPGEYRIRTQDGSLSYIGETNDLYRRTNEHIRSGKLTTGSFESGTIEYKVADGRSTSASRRRHEQEKISKHHPFLNRSKGGEGRPSGK